jgi:hypothetical protein
MKTKDWPDFTRGLSGGGASEVMKAFSSFAQSALAQGALEGKRKD